MKPIIPSTIICFFLVAACNKEGKKQYSEWFVNGDRFYTNDIREDKSVARSQISTNAFNNGFTLTFNFRDFPTSGHLLINCSQQNPDWVCLNFVYRGVGYISPKNSYLQANNFNGHITYKLDSTWFYSILDAQDSVLIKGTINRP